MVFGPCGRRTIKGNVEHKKIRIFSFFPDISFSIFCICWFRELCYHSLLWRNILHCFCQSSKEHTYHFTTATAVLQNDLEVFYFMKMNSFYVIVQTVYEVCHTICIKGLVILHCYSSAIYKGIYFGYDTWYYYIYVMYPVL